MHFALAIFALGMIILLLRTRTKPDQQNNPTRRYKIKKNTKTGYFDYLNNQTAEQAKELERTDDFSVQESSSTENLGIYKSLSKEHKREVCVLLEEKNKLPWMYRDHGFGVIAFKDGSLWRESYDYLDAYEAYSDIEIRDTMPDFAEDYKDQKGKSDEVSAKLTTYLCKSMPFPFAALAGNYKVDLVTLKELGNTAYVFVVQMGKQNVNFMKLLPDERRFLYDVPTVLHLLENFIEKETRLDPVIWLARLGGSFMFIVQKRNMR